MKLRHLLYAAMIACGFGLFGLNEVNAHAMTQKDLGGKTYLVRDTDGTFGTHRTAVVFNPKATRYVSFNVDTDGNGTITKVIGMKSDYKKAMKGGKSLKKASYAVNDDGMKAYYVKHGKKTDKFYDPLLDKPQVINGDENGFTFNYNADGAKKTREYTVAKNPYQFKW